MNYDDFMVKEREHKDDMNLLSLVWWENAMQR